MLTEIIDWVLFSLLKLDSQLKWTEMLSFFIYDSIKILFLLFVMIFIIGFLRTYLPKQIIKKWTSGKKYGIPNFVASFFGAITPFCSCSSIPIFVSFLEAGAPLGVAFSFLITSPLINEYLVVLMLGAFGWKITLAYVISGVLIGVISGLILGKMNLEENLANEFNLSKREKEIEKQELGLKKETSYNFKKRILFGFEEAKSITKKLWLWILIGVGIGSLIHNYVPKEFIESTIAGNQFLSVPLAVLFGIPLYGNSAGMVPIALELFQKGVPLGTALALVMAISALSFPEAIILRRIMNLKLILIFFGIVAISIIITGYLFNFLQIVLV